MISRLLALLLVGCSGDITEAAQRIPTSPGEFSCRWQEIGTWSPWPGEVGVMWVEGSAGVVKQGEDFCPSFRCLYLDGGEVGVMLRDPLMTSSADKISTWSGPLSELPSACPEESKAANK